MTSLGLKLGLSAQRPLAPSFVGPLDGFKLGLLVAWSVWRRLFSSYTGPLIRVRRSSDGAELDIGYNAEGFLDVAAMILFCGSENLFVHVIYAQDGSGLDLIQDVTVYQRRIMTMGALDTLGGVATLRATGAQYYKTESFSTYTGTQISAFVAGCVSISGAYARFLSAGLDDGPDYPSGGFVAVCRNGNNNEIRGESGTSFNAVPAAPFTQFVASQILNGVDANITTADDSAATSFSGSISINQIYVGYQGGGDVPSYDGDCWSSGAVYLTDKTTDEAAIRGAMTP